MITIETTVNSAPSKVWEYWTEPGHIVKWNFASPDWHCPAATNELRIGGQFSYKMAAKDGSVEFDFKGTYQKVELVKYIEYTIEDGRKVMVMFEHTDSGITRITEKFDPEKIHSEELQRKGWQSILNQFKKYAESNK